MSEKQPSHPCGGFCFSENSAVISVIYDFCIFLQPRGNIMTEISDAIAHLQDMSARQIIGLANRYLENAGNEFSSSFEQVDLSDVANRNIKSEISRAHGKIAEARALASHDDVSEMILNRIEAKSHFLSGRLALAIDKPKEAVGHFESCLYVEKEDAQAHFALGIAFMRAGKREQSLESTQTALALDPENMDYLEYWDRYKGTTKLGAFIASKTGETAIRTTGKGAVLVGKGLVAGVGLMSRMFLKK
jgi:tetratricopeptide (TPR) repeat protein